MQPSCVRLGKIFLSSSSPPLPPERPRPLPPPPARRQSRAPRALRRRRRAQEVTGVERRHGVERRDPAPPRVNRHSVRIEQNFRLIAVHRDPRAVRSMLGQRMKFVERVDKGALDPADDVALSSFLDGSTCSPSERLRFPVDEGVFPETDTAPPPSPVNENFGGGVFSTLLAARVLVILGSGFPRARRWSFPSRLMPMMRANRTEKTSARQLRTRVRGMATR